MTGRAPACAGVVALLAALLPCTALADPPRTLHVGPNHTLKVPSDAAQAARDGDTVLIDAGIYDGDAAIWRQNGLTLKGAGGLVRLRAPARLAEAKAIWVVKGDRTTIDGIAFSGARAPTRNGAGIRLEGTGLIVRNSRFRANEMGILTGADPSSDILIERSEFARNTTDYERYGRLGHQIYIGRVRRFTLRHSWVHHASVAHNVKSRAAETFILYNRIVDGAGGNASYLIDLPNGGTAVIMGNELHKSARAENEAAISYAPEGETHARGRLFVVNNSFVNQRPFGVLVRNFSVATPARIVNNLISGPAVFAEGLADLRRNLHVGAGAFVGAASGDLRLAPGVGAIDTGAVPEPVPGLDLVPRFVYRHPAGGAPRNIRGAVDLGAHEFEPR